MKQHIPSHKIAFLSLFLLMFLIPIQALADLESGIAAYEADDFATALAELKPLADGGDAEAQFTLSWMYRAGSGVPSSLEQAARLLRQAADQNHGQAMIELSTFLFYGLGLPPDIPEGVHLLEMAVSQGIPEAQDKLGMIYNIGTYVDRNDAFGRRLLQLAVDQNYLPAMFNLGQLHYYGDGDYIAAEGLFRRAAQSGHSESMYYLGLMYYQGEWLMQDIVKAYMWLQLAVDNGSNSAARAQPQVEAEMEMFDLDDAKRMAQVCQQSNFTIC